jgi:hypothetical protein
MNGKSFVHVKAEKDRRIFLRRCWGLGLAVATGSALVSSCTTVKKPVAKTKAPAETNPCEDLSGVDKVDIEKRKSLGYVSLSPMPDKQCDNCKLWVPAAKGKDCGGCLLFTGPVSPEGNCTYWAPQV